MNPASSRSRIGSVFTVSTSPTRPMSPSWPFASRCSRRRARSSPASLPDSPTALPPWWSIRPTIALLILPTRTISTISTVSSSVTRMPPTNSGSLPSRFMRAPICGPPPWTMTGLMPTKRSRITSSANGSLRSARSMAAPPYLMTTVFPRNSRMYGSASRSTSARRGSVIDAPRRPSQNVPRQVLVARDVAQASRDVAGVDGQLLAGHVRRVERDLLQQPLHDRVEPPGADVLRARVHPHRDLRDRLHRIRREPERHLLRPEELRVLRDQRVLRFRQDADEILARQGVELDADREASLELGDEVRGLGDVEGAGRDEEDVVGAHDPVLGRDRRTLHDGEQVPLDALAGDVGAVARLAPGDLVELVEEDDPRVLGPSDRLGHDLLHVDELLRLLLDEKAPGLGDPHPPPLGPARQNVRQHVLQVEPHLLHALTGEDLDHRHRLLLRLELDHPLVEPARPELDPELVLRGLARGIGRDLLERARREGLGRPVRQQEVEEAILGELLGPLLHTRHHLGLDHVHRQLGEVADHRLHVTPHVTDLGVLGGLDLQERGLGELREPPGDLGLPDAGRADHDDVLRRDLVAQLGGQVLPAPAVAQRDRDRALRPLLADDVAVELGDDLRRGERQLLAHRTSTLMWSLVYTQIEAAMRIASVTIPLASRSECATSARAAASAYGPPEPMPISPSSGSMTSPLPEMMNECSRSATARSASSRRRTRSVRQSLATSTAARARLPRCSSSRLSKRAKSVNASAAVPAKPASTRSWYSLRTFLAPAFTIVFPIETWPSPARATWPRWRTATTVVARNVVAGAVVAGAASPARRVGGLPGVRRGTARPRITWRGPAGARRRRRA